MKSSSTILCCTLESSVQYSANVILGGLGIIVKRPIIGTENQSMLMQNTGILLDLLMLFFLSGMNCLIV